MKHAIGIVLALVALSTRAEVVNFDQYQAGALPPEWAAGTTGRGSPRWSIEPDESGSSKPNILKQSGVADFPWCVLKQTSIVDGFVEVKFKALGGKRDQAGGLVWRWKNGENYYVARANALENNVSLYYTENGRRQTIKYVDVPVGKNTWHVLRVEFSGRHLRVALNGKTYIELDDEHISGSGAVGVWTKADSVTAFDDFSYGASATK